MVAPSPRARERWLPYVVAIAAAILFSVSITGAVSWYGHPFASVLVDPDAVVSGVGSPTWEGTRFGLRFPDRITWVDGTDLTGRRDECPARAFDRAVDTAARAGRESVHVRVSTAAGVREHDLSLAPGAFAWWTLTALMYLAGGLYVVAALTAMRASPEGPLARTFAKTALLCATFMLSFFDAHTTRWLVPLLWTSFSMIPGAFCALALRLPDDAPILRRWPWLVPVVDAAGLGLALLLVVRYLLHYPTDEIRSACTLLLGASQIFFVVTFLVRFARARGERRTILRALLAAIAPPHALVGAGILLALVSADGSAATVLITISIPVLSLLPISSVVAFLRHDLWGSRALVSRVATLTGAGGLAFVFSSGLGAAFVASLGVPIASALLGSTTGALAAAGIVTLALRLSDWRFFRARAQYKPTIEHLSEDLTSLTDPEAVAQAVERVVRRSLSCSDAVLLLEQDARPEVSPAGGASNLFAPPSPARPLRQELSVPVVLGDRRLGTLRAAKGKLSDAPFTSDDRDLLRTIGNQAALAVAYTRSYREIEERRRRQAEAWRGERGARDRRREVAHEIRYPIYSSAPSDRSRLPTLETTEEIEIGREEVERLERLTAGLRRLEHRRLERRVVAVSEIVARAELLLRDALGARALEVAVPPGLALRGDVDQLTQVLVNLLSNALDAIEEGGEVGVTWSSEGGGGAIIVWDSGRGFDCDSAALFTPWFTTKPKGTGLGLAISHRIVRAHGWSIDARRAGTRTEFVVSIVSTDITRADPAAST